MTPNQRPSRDLLLIVLLLVLTFGTWWAWLGWDHEYYTDPATGDPAGPYRPWQVIGCIVTLLVICGIAYAVLHPVLVGVAATVGFTAAFASSALPADESGLAMVGVVMVLIGMATASVVFGVAAHSIRLHIGRSRGTGVAFPYAD